MSNQKTREPIQDRSKARVDTILNATKALIVEKGSANIKIQEIAQRAGVTAGSMYQYFPNKQAIMHALMEQYVQILNEMIDQSVPQVDSIKTLSQFMNHLYDQFYELYRREPVLRDIVAHSIVDKSLQNHDIEISRFHASLVFEAAKHLFPETQRAALQRYLFLMMSLAGPVASFFASFEGEEGLAMLETGRFLISEDVFHRFTRPDESP